MSERAPAPSGAVRLLRARSSSPVLLTCEHASPSLPRGLATDRASREILRTHWGSDLGAWELARGLSRRLGAGLVGGRWSRLFIDLNRPVGDPTLVRREVSGHVLPWNRRLCAAEVERRVLEVHAPFHAEIDRQIVRRLLRGVRPLLLAVHTFTPRLGRSVRGFDLGVLYDDHPAMARRLGGLLRDRGLDVRYNRPYSGVAGMMYSVDRHSAHHRLPCLEIEVNQALLLGGPSGRGRLEESLARAIDALLEGRSG